MKQPCLRCKGKGYRLVGKGKHAMLVGCWSCKGTGDYLKAQQPKK